MMFHFLEQAPVSGSKKPAEDGQLIFLTAGEAFPFNIFESLIMKRALVRYCYKFLI